MTFQQAVPVAFTDLWAKGHQEQNERVGVPRAPSRRVTPGSWPCPECAAGIESGVESCLLCGQARRPWKQGQVIADRYELMRVLGRGGMGTVYEAHDRALDEPVALKVLSETRHDPVEAGRRFRAEIKLARRIRHPNVCAIHEYGEFAGLQYIVMELVHGRNLSEHLTTLGRLTPREATLIVSQMGHGLQAIHEAGVIHRDLKLSNVMVDGAARVRLMDFGIAKRIGAVEVTACGLILGTPAYMSPEQVQGQPVGPATDVYALGIMTYELLTGRLPFEADSPQATAWLRVNEGPRLDDPAVPPVIVPILSRVLARQPQERYQTAVEFTAALCDALSRPSPAIPASQIGNGTLKLPLGIPAPAPFLQMLEAEGPPLLAQESTDGSCGGRHGPRRWIGFAILGGASVLVVSLATSPVNPGAMGRPGAEPAASHEPRAGVRPLSGGMTEAPAPRVLASSSSPPGSPASVGQAREALGASRFRPAFHPPAPPRTAAAEHLYELLPATEPTPGPDAPSGNVVTPTQLTAFPSSGNASPAEVGSQAAAGEAAAPVVEETGRPADAAQWRVREPRKIKHVNPEYPAIALAARTEGLVVVGCTIDPQGRVVRAVVLRGIQALNRAATDAIRQWVYEPTLINGAPVSVEITVTINFTLDREP